MMSLIWILACPLGMFAMGGVVWVLARVPGSRAQRLARASSRLSCMPLGGAGRQADAKSEAEQESTKSEALTHA